MTHLPKVFKVVSLATALPQWQWSNPGGNQENQLVPNQGTDKDAILPV